MPTDVEILTAAIKLDQFLKWAGLAQTGGEAKQLIQQGLATVNGEPEARRGRSLVPGDIVTIQGKGDFAVVGPKG